MKTHLRGGRNVESVRGVGCSLRTWLPVHCSQTRSSTASRFQGSLPSDNDSKCLRPVHGLTVEDLVVSRVGHDELVVWRPVQVCDVAGMALGSHRLMSAGTGCGPHTALPPERCWGQAHRDARTPHLVETRGPWTWLCPADPGLRPAANTPAGLDSKSLRLGLTQQRYLLQAGGPPKLHAAVEGPEASWESCHSPRIPPPPPHTALWHSVNGPQTKDVPSTIPTSENKSPNE